MNPKSIVAHGYDHIAEQYAAWSSQAGAGERAQYTAHLIERLPAGAHVLELGCGTGVPTAQTLAQHFRVIGVDISSVSIDLARKNVPAASFRVSDMTALDFPSATFDAIVAFYAIIHVPRDEQAELLCRITAWLKPGGTFIATMGSTSNEAQIEADWLGTPMYWSHFDADKNQNLIRAAGLTIQSADVQTDMEDGSPISFLWVVATK